MTQSKNILRNKDNRSHSCAQLKTDHFSGSVKYKKELIIRISDHNVNRTKARIKEIDGEETITIRKKDQPKVRADIFLFYPDSYLNNVKYILEK